METTTDFDFDTEQAERDARTDLCDECRDLDHPTCSLDASCACCLTTIAQMAEEG
jgi:hypothetical protein